MADGDVGGIEDEDALKMQRAIAKNATSLRFEIDDNEVGEEDFKDAFRMVGTADHILVFSDGHEESKPWVLHNLGEDANIRGNVQSQGWWRNRHKTGLISVVCKIRHNQEDDN